MNHHPTFRRLAPPFLILVLALLIPALAAGQDQPPSIPHPVEGREACLVCHETGVAGAVKIPDDHAGRPNEVCQACHQVASAAEEATDTPTAAAEPTKTPTSEPTRTPTAVRTRTPTPAVSATATETQVPEASATTLTREPTATATSRATSTATPTASATATRPSTATPTPEPTATLESQAREDEGGPPAVPHTLEGREDCLACHISSETGAVAAGGPPTIPHSLVGRENCLACHQDGIGGATKVPADHSGRTNETCQGCHLAGQEPAEPTATPQTEPIPTPLVYPKAAGVNTCLDCHLELPGKHGDITAQWQRSIHAERDVSCADCHGGDPSATTVDEAMSPEAGYIGAPAKADIPALCASCHSDVTLMRQYDLPTDQYAKYKESVHGVQLAEGDDNVATCYECHGGHQVMKANDPGSTVYPAKVPEMCASCHADADLMAPYDIPTNQFDLYRQSVHGHALLDNQDFRAPNCATCHGTHGAAPPGFEEVANVCGSCHTATQDHYLKSPHASADGEDAPKCVTCHGRYDVSKPSEALYLGTEPRHCGSCHAPDSEGGQLAQTLYDEIDSAAQAYAEAEEAVQAAKGVGMLVTAQESLLQQANTDLVTARAAQHNLDGDQVIKISGEARDAADEAKAGAEAAVEASVLRRRAMVVAVVAIGLTIAALYLLKRELDRRLEASS